MESKKVRNTKQTDEISTSKPGMIIRLAIPAKILKGEIQDEIEAIFSIHLKRTVRKDGTIMFMGKKWDIGCPEGASITVCFMASEKFMLLRDGKKIWELCL